MLNRREYASTTAFWSLAGVVLAACHHDGGGNVSVAPASYFQHDELPAGATQGGVRAITGTARTEGETESSTGALYFASTNEPNSALTIRVTYTNQAGVLATEEIDQPEQPEQYSEAIRTQYGTFVFSARQNNDDNDEDASISWRYTLLPDLEIPTEGLFDRITVSIEGSEGRQDQRILEIPINYAPTLTAGGEAMPSIAENVEDGTATGYTLTVAGIDTIGASETFTVMEGGSESANFEMQRVDDTNVWNLVVRANNNINYEDATSHALSITVFDGTATSAAETVTVTITDVDEGPPELTAGGTAPSIAENAADAGTATGYTLTVTDPDTRYPHAFRVMEGVSESANFVMQRVGTSNVWNLVVRTGNSINYEDATSHTLSITVNDGTVDSVAEEVTVAITDVDEGPPELTAGGAAMDIAEDTDAGTATGYTLTVTDPDTRYPHAFTVEEGGSESANFVMQRVDDSNVWNLVVREGNSIDYEMATSHVLSITVNDGTTTSAAQTVTVTITNVELGLVAGGDHLMLELYENIGLVLRDPVPTGYTLTVIDSDPGDSLTFTVMEGGSESTNFEMQQIGTSNVYDLVVIMGNSINYEDATSHDLSITVNDGTITSTAKEFTVTILDVNDVIPTLEAMGTASIAADAADGTATGYTLTLTDPDSVSPHEFRVLEGGSESDNFEMAQIGTSNIYNLVLSEGHSIMSGVDHDLSITVSDGLLRSDPETTVTVDVM